ncbi:MAG: extracellular solute-binding protein [Clostridia bacterium]|nr:extracellular solute-binding protein [Clostridia bacterium]
MKKILALVLAVAMLLSLTAFASADFSGEIKIWVAENTVAFTEEKVAEFKAEHPEYAGMTVTIQPVGEGDAAGNMITDVESGADIFGFAQDQLARLVAAGALEEVEEGNAAVVEEENDAGSVGAVKLGDTMYAYPMTSDNGYFLYYDSTVISDVTTLEGVLDQAAAAGKSVYFELNSGWYQTAFFFGAGCELTFDTDDEGNLVGMNSSYGTEAGVRALKAMIAVANHPAFVNGSSVSNATNAAAVVSGTWDSDAAKTLFGEGYAAAKLPTVDGFQLGGFGGFKMLGVKPQVDEDKLAACDALAAFLTSEKVQIDRYNAVGWGPSNKAAQQIDAVQQDVALSALAAQLAFCAPQGQYPGDYWARATALGDDVIAHKFDGLDDAALLAVMQQFEQDCASYLNK